MSHDPATLIRLHAGLFAGVTVLALLYLANVLNVSPWFAPMTMLGPFFFFYSRLLWDNTFAIPIGTLLLAAYGDQFRRPNRVAFFTFVSCGLALPFIHLMTLPLVIAVACHAIVPHRRVIRRHWVGLIVIYICLTFSCGAYVSRVLRQAGHSSALMAPAPDHLRRGGGCFRISAAGGGCSVPMDSLTHAGLSGGWSRTGPRSSPDSYRSPRIPSSGSEFLPRFFVFIGRLALCKSLS